MAIHTTLCPSTRRFDSSPSTLISLLCPQGGLLKLWYECPKRQRKDFLGTLSLLSQILCVFLPNQPLYIVNLTAYICIRIIGATKLHCSETFLHKSGAFIALKETKYRPDI